MNRETKRAFDAIVNDVAFSYEDLSYTLTRRESLERAERVLTDAGLPNLLENGAEPDEAEFR